MTKKINKKKPILVFKDHRKGATDKIPWEKMQWFLPLSWCIYLLGLLCGLNTFKFDGLK